MRRAACLLVVDSILMDNRGSKQFHQHSIARMAADIVNVSRTAMLDECFERVRDDARSANAFMPEA